MLERLERKVLPRPDKPGLFAGWPGALQTHRFLLALSDSFTRLRLFVTHIYYENIVNLVQSISFQLMKYSSVHPSSSILQRNWNKFLMKGRNLHYYMCCHFTENRTNLFLLLKTKRKKNHNPSLKGKQYQNEKFVVSHHESHARDSPEFLLWEICIQTHKRDLSEEEALPLSLEQIPTADGCQMSSEMQMDLKRLWAHLQVIFPAIYFPCKGNNLQGLTAAVILLWRRTNRIATM